MRPLLMTALLVLTGCEYFQTTKQQVPADGHIDDGAVEDDGDGDGIPFQEDCDDADASRFPGNVERCDGVDNDCDGEVDEGAMTTWWADADDDGFGDPDAPVEACDQPSGAVENADDCDDTNPTARPGQPEECDEVDNDCDGTVDEGVQTTFYADTDADGFGDADVPTLACAAPSGFVLDATDCDDTNDAVFPGNPEVCDALDNDCNDEIDEGVKTTFYADTDEDGFGDEAVTALACDAPSGFVADGTDCDDTRDVVFPGNPEVCDELDNNCDNDVDEGVQTTFYADTDADGFGDAASPVLACSLPPGAAADDTDCDDTTDAVNPSAAEIPFDGIDQNCEGNDGPLVALSSPTAGFVAREGYDATSSTSTTVTNGGEGTLGWTASVDQPWVSLSDTSGGEGDGFDISVDTTGLAEGTHTATVTVADDLEGFTTGTVAVELEVAETFSGDTTWTYERDGTGRITAIDEPTGETTTVTYNGLGLPLTMSSTTGDTSSFAYNANGMLTSSTNDEGTLSFTYDEDQIETITWPDGGVQTYTWDSSGRVEELELPNGDVIEWSYTATQGIQPDTVTSTASGTIQFTYDGDGRMDSRTLSDGTTTSYTYDATTGRVSSILHEDASGNTLVELTQSFDSLARVSTQTRSDGTTSETRTYTYDEMGRLEEVASTAGDSWSFTYDAAGNRTSRTENGATTDYVYDSENRLLQAGDEVFEYDASGRMTARITPDGTTTYTWDGLGRLVEVDDGDRLVTYAYTAEGMRISRDVDGETTSFYHDVQGLVPSLVQAETTTTAGSTTTTYVRGVTLAYVDVDGTGYGVLGDDRGGTVGLVGASSLHDFTYTPFGVPQDAPTSLDASAVSLGFNGEERDPVTGLIYLRNRYYDPALGRFLSPDLATPDQRRSGTWNSYAYCENDPINFVDPTGLVRWDTVALGALNVAGSAIALGTILAAAPVIAAGGGVAAVVVGAAAGYQAVNAAFGAAQVVGGVAYDAAPSEMPSSIANLAADAYARANPDDARGAVIASGAAMLFDTLMGGVGGNYASSAASVGGTIIDWSGKLQTACDLASLASSAHQANNYYEASGQPCAPWDWGDDTESPIEPTTFGDDLRGGVYLNASAQVIGDLSQIQGVSVDPATGQLIFYGEEGGLYAEGVSGDMFITALHWLYDSLDSGVFTPPGVTIENDLVPTAEPNPPDTTNTYHGVGYFGGIEYTEAGYAAFEADRILKSFSLGVDTDDGSSYDWLQDTVPDYECRVDLYEYYYDGTSPSGWVRFWIEPDEMLLTVDQSRDAMAFTTASMHVQYEDESDTTARWDDYDHWTEVLTDNYDGIAEEIESWEDLRTAAKMVAVATYLYETELYKTLNWDEINATEVEEWDTPWWTLEGSVTSSFDYQGQTLTTQFVGGASLSNGGYTSQADTGTVEAYVDEVLDARGSDSDVSWSYTAPDGSTGTAVAVQTTPAPIAGGAHLVDADLGTHSTGRIPLALLRSYSSVLAAAGADLGMGAGWSFVPMSAVPSSLDYAYGSYPVPFSVEVRNHVLGQSAVFEFQYFSSTLGATYTSTGRPLDDLYIDSSGDMTWVRVDGSEIVFDSAGQLQSTVENTGAGITYSWTDDELDTITDDNGEALSLTWAGGQLTGAETDDGRTVSYSYDADGLLSGMTDADGAGWSFSYDASGLLDQITASDGAERFSAVYDAYARATSQFFHGEEQTTTASLVDGTTLIEDGAGVGVTYQTDADGELYTITDGEGGVWTYSWTDDGLLASIEDPEGYTRSYTYDDYGNVATFTNEEGDTASSWWTWSTATGSWVLNAYETAGGDGRYVSHNSDGTIGGIWDATLSTNSDGDLTGVSLGSRRISATYNSDGQITGITRGNLTQSTTYDADGRVASTTDMSGAGLTYTYDTAGRLSSTTSTEGVTRSFTYAGADTPLVEAVSLGGTVLATHDYDSLGRLAEVVDALGATTTLEYASVTGALAEVTDAQGATLTYARDGGGRLTGVSTSWGQARSYAYDQAGRLASVTRTVTAP